MRTTVPFNLLFSEQLIIHEIVSNYNLSSNQLGAKFNQNEPIQNADGTQNCFTGTRDSDSILDFPKKKKNYSFLYLP